MGGNLWWQIRELLQETKQICSLKSATRICLGISLLCDHAFQPVQRWDIRTGSPTVEETNIQIPAAPMCCFSLQGLEGRKGQHFTHLASDWGLDWISFNTMKRTVYLRTTVMRRQIPWTQYGSKVHMKLKSRFYYWRWDHLLPLQ